LANYKIIIGQIIYHFPITLIFFKYGISSEKRDPEFFFTHPPVDLLQHQLLYGDLQTSNGRRVYGRLPLLSILQQRFFVLGQCSTDQRSDKLFLLPCYCEQVFI